MAEAQTSGCAVRPVAARPRGFTLVELLTACVIVSTIAMGTYGILGQALRFESTANRRARARATAVPVLEHLAEAVRQACEPIGQEMDGPGGTTPVTALQAQPGTLTVLTLAGATGGRERRQYTWPTGAEQKIALELKSILYAGATPLTSVDLEKPDESGIWNRLPSRAVGAGLDQLKVEFLELEKPGARWVEKHKGPAVSVAVRIRIWAMGECFERVIVPPAHWLGTVVVQGEATE
jgi:prepilin-type N-terminal cleavage/methylation domain-containing protein